MEGTEAVLIGHQFLVLGSDCLGISAIGIVIVRGK
jgi:hypothetical protein